MKIIILNTLFFLIAITVHAQLTDWQNISSNNFVMKIIHDQNFLYVGTKGGGIVKIGDIRDRRVSFPPVDYVLELIPLSS